VVTELRGVEQPPPLVPASAIWITIPSKRNLSIEGSRLSKPGCWSLSVGDSVKDFDRRLGNPIHTERTWKKDGSATARYKLGPHEARYTLENGLCVVKVDLRTHVVTDLAVYEVNVWSINVPVRQETPGAWLSFYDSNEAPAITTAPQQSASEPTI
jgi:hypothetical protein